MPSRKITAKKVAIDVEASKALASMAPKAGVDKLDKSKRGAFMAQPVKMIKTFARKRMLVKRTSFSDGVVVSNVLHGLKRGGSIVTGRPSISFSGHKFKDWDLYKKTGIRQIDTLSDMFGEAETRGSEVTTPEGASKEALKLLEKKLKPSEGEVADQKAKEKVL